MKKLILIVALALVFTGCASEKLTQKASQVRSISVEQTADCTFVGSASGKMASGWTSGANSLGSLNEVKNQIAEMGGNAYVLTMSHSGDYGSSANADGYHCPQYK